MATSKKTAPKKAQNSAQPDIITGTPEIEAPVPETPTETIPDLAETRKTPEQIALEDYGVDHNCFNTTVIMRAVLFELVRIHSVLEGAASVRK